jgi:peptide/nickel transport system ATP-binding protein
VAYICDHVVVMYAGQVAESGTVEAVLTRPYHPYTMGLYNAFPDLERSGGTLVPIEGSPPSLLDPPRGCRFEPRCPFSIARCAEPPPLAETEPGHRAACWRSGEAARLRELAARTEVWERRGEAQPAGVA